MKRCFSARPNHFLPALVFAALATAALCGCSKGSRHVDVQPVEGQVMWNGKPLEGAQVVFCPQGDAAAGVSAPRARTGPDGRFHLGTYDKADGAPEGQYVVTVVDFPLLRTGSEAIPGPNVLPQKYANPKTSDLRAQIAKGPNVLPALQLR